MSVVAVVLVTDVCGCSRVSEGAAASLEPGEMDVCPGCTGSLGLVPRQACTHQAQTLAQEACCC